MRMLSSLLIARRATTAAASSGETSAGATPGNGTASAALGATQFLLAAAVSPLVSLAGERTAGPLGIVMVCASAVACAGLVLARNQTAGPS